MHVNLKRNMNIEVNTNMDVHMKVDMTTEVNMKQTMNMHVNMKIKLNMKGNTNMDVNMQGNMELKYNVVSCMRLNGKPMNSAIASFKRSLNAELEKRHIHECNCIQLLQAQMTTDDAHPSSHLCIIKEVAWWSE